MPLGVDIHDCCCGSSFGSPFVRFMLAWSASMLGDCGIEFPAGREGPLLAVRSPDPLRDRAEDGPGVLAMGGVLGGPMRHHERALKVRSID